MNLIKLPQPSFFSARKHQIVAVILILTLLLSVIGIGITDYSPANAYGYWLLMTVILAVAGTAISWINRAALPDQQIKKLLMTQFIHWVATAATVLGIFLLLKTGRLNYESVGLVLLLTLGLSTFLDGYRIDWRFSLLGVLMFLSAILATYIEEYLWIIIVITVILIILIVLWERRKNPLTTEIKE